MGTAERLASLGREHGRALMAAKQKDGSIVIHIAPGAQDITKLLMTAAMELDQSLKEA